MPRPVPRRTALAWGALGLGGATVLAGCDPEPLRDLTDDAREAVAEGVGGAWVEPVVLSSAAGVLEVHVRVEVDSVTVAGATARMVAFQGAVPGPTLHLRPGDILKVRLINALSTATSLHLQGMRVAPSGSGDSPFVEIAPGQTRDYSFVLPLDHPQGVFWYRPQAHGTAAAQVFAGAYGAIVVDRHDWTVAAPRVILMSDTTLAGGRVVEATQAEREQGRVGDTLLANGRLAPPLRVRPGVTERWLLINACASRYLDLGIGDRNFRVLALDSGGLEPARVTSRLVLPPGGRAHVEMIIPQGEVELRAAAYGIGTVHPGRLRGRVAYPEDAVVLTVMPDAGAPATRPTGPSEAVPVDLRERSVDVSRVLELTSGDAMGQVRFLINGAAYDPERVDLDVVRGAVEEWTLRNAASTDLPFHLHTWPMQVVFRGENAVEGVELLDVVDVPKGEDVTVRIRFDRAGTSVYECQILDHADAGMKGVVQVAPQSTS